MCSTKRGKLSVDLHSLDATAKNETGWIRLPVPAGGHGGKTGPRVRVWGAGALLSEESASQLNIENARDVAWTIEYERSHAAQTPVSMRRVDIRWRAAEYYSTTLVSKPFDAHDCCVFECAPYVD